MTFRASSFMVAMLLATVAIPHNVSASVAIYHAQANGEQEAEKKEKKREPARALSNSSVRYVQRLLKIFDLQEDKEQRPEGLLPEDYVAIIAVLDDWRTGSRRLRSYDASVMWNYYAFVYQTQENYVEARKAYLKVIEQEHATYQLRTQSLLAVAQIDFLAEDYASAYEWLNKWYEASDEHRPSTVILLSQAAYQLKKYVEAIKWADVSIDSHVQEQGGGIAKENWYVIKLASLSSLKRDFDVIDLLEFMVIAFPKKQYWVQLAGFYGETKQTEAQLATWEAALIAGFLDREAEVLAIGQLNANFNSPYRGARVVTYGIDSGIVEKKERNVRMLADLWYAAHEYGKAAGVLEKYRETAEDGGYLEKLGYIYVQADETDKAIKTLREAVKQNGLRDKPTAAMLVGQLFLNEQKYEESVEEFDRWLRAYPAIPNRGDRNKKAREKRAKMRQRVRTLRRYSEGEIAKLQEIARIEKQEIPFDAL